MKANIMGFTPIKSGHGPRDTAHVSIGSLMLGTGYGGRFYVSRDVGAAMKWKAGATIAVEIGSDSDYGWARLIPSPLGNRLRHVGRDTDGGLALCATRLGDRKRHSMEAVEYRIEDDALYVKLPEWALPNNVDD